MTKRKPSSENGVALVTTVIVVAVLAVVAVAFMQSASMDRLSSRTVANYYRAQLAAEAGLAFAGAILATNSSNDTFIVVANTNGQLFLGNGSNRPPGEIAYIPAFSTVSSVSTPIAPIVTNTMPTVDVEAGTQFDFADLPGGISITSPPVSWVYLTESNATGAVRTNARFAFWVEDLAGKLDLSVVGVNGAGDPSAVRPTGTNPAEIALWSVFNPTSTSDPGNAIATSLVSARSNLLTAATARLVNSGVTPDFLKDLATGLRRDTNELATIPFGFGYADAGKAKFNINTNLSAAGGEEIVKIIQRNLPNFAADRAGGMNQATYLNYLAANIVDYADADSTPVEVGSQQAGDEPSQAGNEPMPWLNEVHDRFQWQGHPISGEPAVTYDGTNYYANLSVETYMEFWNMTDKEASGDLRIEIDETGVELDANGKTGKAASKPWEFTTSVEMPPNAYEVMVFTNEIPSLVWGPTPPAGNALVGTPKASVKYKVFWNGVLIDNGLGDLERTSSSGVSQTGQYRNRWRGNAFVADANRSEGRVGDPRINRHINVLRRHHTYFPDSRTSWGGRNYAAGLDAEYNEVKNWSDGSYITNSPRGIPANSLTDLPTDAAARATKYPHAPSKISNAGEYTNLAELGSIFDPIQWNVSALDGPGHVSSSTIESAAAGGGNTLRIGRAEHPRFTNDGRRAAQLLDIFAAGPTNAAGAVLNNGSGRINLNTASTNVLRALVAGVSHQSDPALTPTSNLVVPTTAVAAFVDAVQRFRAQRPFLAPSQLPLLATNNTTAAWPSNSVFGNRTLMGVTEWNDSAAEEWFAKIFSLSTVRSRNFVVYVEGQALQPTDPTKPVSKVRAAYQIYVEPIRDPGSGATTNSIVRVINSWSL